MQPLPIVEANEDKVAGGASDHPEREQKVEKQVLSTQIRQHIQKGVSYRLFAEEGKHKNRE